MEFGTPDVCLYWENELVHARTRSLFLSQMTKENADSTKSNISGLGSHCCALDVDSTGWLPSRQEPRSPRQVDRS